MSNPTANDLYREAQALVKQGQPVFPVRSVWLSDAKQDKQPLVKWKTEATLDLGVIKAWWKRFGTSAALAIPTGIVWDVLDVDIKDDADGRVHLPALRKRGLLNGCQRLVKTPSGGWHLYFPVNPALTNKGRAATLGLDVRANGGYVLAPPSYIETPDYKGVYEELPMPIAGDGSLLHWDLVVSSIAPMNTKTNEPIELLPAGERGASLAALREWLAQRQDGERNNSLHWAVCRCIDNGLDPHELMEVALHLGLGEEEITKTINSALFRAGVSVNELHTEAEAMFGTD